MAKKPLKFGPKRYAAGGSTDRSKARYDRKVADIESDYAKAMKGKTGRAAEVAKAKYDQRMADAKDDLAKWTGADRTQTRAAERAAERELTLTRRYGSSKPKLEDKPLVTSAGPSEAELKKISTMAPAAKQTFKEAFAAARKDPNKPKTFTWEGKSFSTALAGEKKAAPRPTGSRSAAPARQSVPAATPSRTPAPAATTKQVNKPAPATTPAPAGRKGLSGDEYAKAIKSGVIPGHASAEDRANIMGTIKAKQQAAGAKPYVPPKPKEKPVTEAERNAAIRRSNANPWSNQNIAGSKKGGVVKKYAKGGSVRSVDGIAKRGKTRAPMKKGK